MRDRFGIVEHLEFYTPDELAEIVTRSAGILNIELAGEANRIIAGRFVERHVSQIGFCVESEISRKCEQTVS